MRLTLKEIAKGSPGADGVYEIDFDRELNRTSQFSGERGEDLWMKLPEDARNEALEHVRSRFLDPTDDLSLKAEGRSYSVSFFKEDVRFPFRPVKGHLMGIDGAGRDVFARVL